MAKRHRQPDAVCGGGDSGRKKLATAAVAVPSRRVRTYSSSRSGETSSVEDGKHELAEDHNDTSEVSPHAGHCLNVKSNDPCRGIRSGDAVSSDEDENNDLLSIGHTASTGHASSKVHKDRYSDDDDGRADANTSDDDDDSRADDEVDSDDDSLDALNDEEEEDGRDSDTDGRQEKGQITVDFGVYDLTAQHTNAIMHLLDQFCPDHMNEIDRDTLAAALLASPYSCVVRVNDNDDGDDESSSGKQDEGRAASSKKDAEEEEELFGLASIVDVVHSRDAYRQAMTPLIDLLRSQVWRTAAVGLSPLDVLLSTTPAPHSSVDNRATSQRTMSLHRRSDDGKAEADGDTGAESANTPQRRSNNNSEDKGENAKCVLLVSEYIRTVPLELTVQILDDLVTRLGQDSKRRIAVESMRHNGDGASIGSDDTTHDTSSRLLPLPTVRATFPCMYAIMAKMQRAVQPPVTLIPPPISESGGPSTSSGSHTHKANQSSQTADKNNNDSSSRSRSNNLDPQCSTKHATPAVTMAQEGSKQKHTSTSTAEMAASSTRDALDMSAYVFWHEEDGVLYEFRDKRVAALVYRCRAQYDGQPEQELPLSVLFVVQHGAMLQAIAEMHKRATAHADVVRF